MIEKFKKSQDFIDICYMIDHVDDLQARISVLETLGYKVGISVVKDNNAVKDIVVAKNKKELRIQVTPKFGNLNYAKCVVVEPKK